MDKDKKKKREFDNFVFPQYVESWIQGFPLKTDYGFIRPLKVSEYWKYVGEMDFLKKQGWEVKKMFLKELKGNDSTYNIVKEDFENSSFIVCLRNNVANLRDIYNKIFELVIYDFDEKKFYWSVTQDEFDDLRRLILDFNHIHYHEKNPNPKIEHFNKMKNYIASKKGGMIEFDAVYSTLMTKEGGGFLPEQINNLTIRQFYLAFKRVEFNKAHDTTTLYKTVDSKDSINVVEWSRSFREENEEITFDSVEELRKSSNVFLKKK